MFAMSATSQGISRETVHKGEEDAADPFERDRLLAEDREVEVEAEAEVGAEVDQTAGIAEMDVNHVANDQFLVLVLDLDPDLDPAALTNLDVAQLRAVFRAVLIDLVPDLLRALLPLLLDQTVLDPLLAPALDLVLVLFLAHAPDLFRAPSHDPARDQDPLPQNQVINVAAGSLVMNPPQSTKENEHDRQSCP